MLAGPQFQRENNWCMRGIADEAYAAGMQDCMKAVCARAYIARSKQIEAKKKRTSDQGERVSGTTTAGGSERNDHRGSERNDHRGA